MSCTTNAVPEYSTRYLVLVDRHLCLTMGIGRRSCCSMGTCVGTSVDVVQSMSCPFLSFSRRSVGSRGVSDATKHHRLFIGSPTYHLFKCSSIGINNDVPCTRYRCRAFRFDFFFLFIVPTSTSIARLLHVRKHSALCNLLFGHFSLP